MAQGIYMGGEVLKGKASKEIRDLVSGIKAQQDKFAKQSGKAKLWDLGGDVLQTGLSLFGGVPGIIGGGLLDLLIDQVSGRSLMSKAGDPEAIKKLQTPYTGGGYGEEFEKMLTESKPDFLSGLLQEGVEGLTTYAGGEFSDKLNLGDWFSNLFGGDGVKEKAMSGIEEAISSMKRTSYNPSGFREGGRVPKYYGGGSVSGGSPTIAGYFSEQGKTLGGSNKQSLAEMPGRR
jgi:hypothetical protein